MVVGDPNDGISDFYLGYGVISGAPGNSTIHATGGTGTNIAGAGIYFAGGKATGNAAGGAVFLQTSDPGASGTTLQTLTTKATLLVTGQWNWSQYLLTTSFAGTPVGAIGFDATGNILTMAVGGGAGTVTDFIFTDANGFDGTVTTSTTTPTLVLTTTLTQGSVFFAGAAGALAEDNTNLFFDNTNNILGIGINSSFTATRLNVVDNAVAGASIVSITSTSTAAAGDAQKALNISLTGANGTGNQFTFGAHIVNAHTGGNNLGIQSEANGDGLNYAVVGRISVATTNSASAAILADNDGSVGYGLWAISSGGTAINAESSSTGNVIVSTTSGSGIAVWGTSGTGTGGSFTNSSESVSALLAYKDLASTNTAVTVLSVARYTSGSAAAGIGAKLRFALEDDTFQDELSNELVSILTNVTHANKTSQLMINGVLDNSTTSIISFEGNKRTILYGRLEMQQGADVASVAGAIALGFDGNTFEITGTNAITLISNVGWQNGSEVNLLFTSTASLTDGTANSGTDIGFELAGNANFTGSADDVITLILCEIGGTQRWREKCRSVN